MVLTKLLIIIVCVVLFLINNFLYFSSNHSSVHKHLYEHVCMQIHLKPIRISHILFLKWKFYDQLIVHDNNRDQLKVSPPAK